MLILSTLNFWSRLLHLCIWAFPLLQKGFQSKISKRMEESVDKDEMAHYVSSNLYPSRKHAYLLLTSFNSHFYIVKLRFTEVYIFSYFCSKT